MATLPGHAAEAANAGGEAGERSRSGFQQHIHVFRGIAICLIIGAHSVPSFDWSTRLLTGRIIDAICNQSSVLFFFIAGYLFQYLSARFDYRRYLKQKLKTVLLPYFLVSIPAIVISVGYIRQEGMWPWFYDQPVWAQILLFYLTGKHLEPLWFVPTISLFYLAAPLLLWVDRRPKLYWALLPLLIMAVLLGRDGPHGPIDKAIYLFPAYLFGMCFSHFRDRAEYLSRRMLPLFIALTLAAYALLVAAPSEAYDLQILAKLASVPLFILALKWLAPRLDGRMGYIAHVSFGIFFVHAYFISAFRLFYSALVGVTWKGAETTALFAASISGFILHLLLVLGASVLTIWVVQRLFPSNSRQLIGA